MPRTRRVNNTDYPYHINAKTNDGLPFPCDLQDAWEIYCNALWFYSRIFQVRILAFVMMSNHFHLLISTPNGNLSEFMKQFMKRTSDDIRAIRGIKNHLYGDRYFPSLVKNQNYFQNVLKYVYQNPVKAGICDSVLQYDYTTLHGFLGLKKMEIPIFDDYHFFEDLNGNMRWLDERFTNDAHEQIQHGLRLQEFKFKPNSSYYLNDTLSKTPTPSDQT